MSDSNHDQETDRRMLNYKKITKSASFSTAIVVVLALALSFSRQQIAKWLGIEEVFDNLIIIIGIAWFFFFLAGVIIWAIIFSTNRNKEISQIIKEQPEVCKDIQHELSSIQQVATHLRNVTTELEIGKFILSGTKVNELEASVKKDMRILIFTSKFILEQNPVFVEVINRNFRKGVKYTYLVPSSNAMLVPYFRMIKSWYSNFAEFVEDKEKANIALNVSQEDASHDQVWNPAYVELIKKAISAHQNKKNKDKMLKEIKDEIRHMFQEQLLTHTLNPNLFFITVAMYEKKVNNWKAIIKLPTENQEKNFTAFCVSDANIKEEVTFIESIWQLPQSENKYELPDEIFQ
jgi:hypothetical protein